ncbi:hypothetical protein OSB04_un000813 [Centaurea solstitialis]|uniref:Bidirectional sugar transporter SWEET n=1 Tax=Centaurea solstitialis TaxID=347529 RepID=A0AA38SGZ9_9ASTR|nr:hypothetical protein OSB04_un000813 [Centaurea solstitialis]
MTGSLAHLTLAFGLLGNVVSFMVFLAPIPTFYKVYKKKSTEGFQSAPYVVGLFSAMLWIYYAMLKSNVLLLITINSVGCFIETFYIIFFLIYAPKKARMESLKLIVLLIVVGFGLIVALTQFFASGVTRGVIVGWICLVFSLCVFVAPLGVLRQVIKTKSVEYMPILLSVALTLSAVMWFFYGLLLGDFNIAMTGSLAHLTLAFGLLGNVVSFMVFLAPIPTFYKVYKKKSTEGFQSAPYVVGLFSAMLWIYYAMLKSNVLLLITINSVGCFIETFYIIFFLIYAPKKAKMESLKLIALLIVVGFGLIVALTQLFASGVTRGVIVGWICLIFSLCVFVAPLGVLRQVIKTKSVEYMPILLSVALTLSAVMWFFYGLLLGDFNIAIPNVLGFTFGIIQIILYFVYKNKKPIIDEKISKLDEKISEMEEQRIPQLKDTKGIDVVKLKGMMPAEILPGVYKKKSTEGFQSAPYVVGLFSAMLWIYYAMLKSNVLLLITINSVGCFIETFYIIFFLFYAPKKARMESLKLIVLLIFVGFGLIVVLTQFLASGVTRGVIVGWICLIFSLCVFVAPLGVLRQVIKTKSVEYMPILLSVALTLSAVMWFFYGLLLGDFNIAIPNVLGFTFGIIQMILYFVYKNKKPIIDEKISNFDEKISEMEEQRIPDFKDTKSIDVIKLKGMMPVEILPGAGKYAQNANHVVVVEPRDLQNMPNHTIQVGA